MMGSEEGKLLAWDEPLVLEPLEERESAVPLQDAPQSAAKWIAKLEAAIQYELSSKNIRHYRSR